MKNNWIRFLAGAAASVVLVGAVALAGGMKDGKRTDGLLYQASGLHPDGELMTISGETVSCEEYLYWLAYDCDYLAGQQESLDWDSEAAEGMTFGEYARAEATAVVKQQAVVRAWAREAGIRLSDEDTAELETLRQQYVSYYGSEEAFARQLALAGISEEVWYTSMKAQYLYRDLYEAFCTPGSGLYPDETALADYAAAQSYMGVYVLSVTDENDAEGAANELLARWQAAEDRVSEYAAICEELGQGTGSAMTLAAVAGDPLSDAIAALEMGGMAAVIDPYENGTSYVVMRTEADMSAVAQTYFDVLWEQRLENAVVVVNSKLYDTIDTGAFYEKLTQLRTDMAAESGDTAG